MSLKNINSGRCASVSKLSVEHDLETASVHSEKVKLMGFPDVYWCVRVQNIPRDDWDGTDQEFKFDFEFSGITPELRNMCRVKFEIFCSDVQVVNTKFVDIDPRLNFNGTLYEFFPFRGCFVTFELFVIADYLDSATKPAVASGRILKGLSSMLNDSTFADFTFIVKGHEFKVHKCILATASPVMAKMLTTDMEEGKSNKCTIEHITSETFSHLLEFVYSGNFGENFSGTDAIALYEAAHYFEIMDLKETCHQNIRCVLTVENAVELYKWAQPYDLEELKADAWLIIKRDILKIFKPIKDEPVSIEVLDQIVALKQQEDSIAGQIKSLIN